MPTEAGNHSGSSQKNCSRFEAVDAKNCSEMKVHQTAATIGDKAETVVPKTVQKLFDLVEMMRDDPVLEMVAHRHHLSVGIAIIDAPLHLNWVRSSLMGEVLHLHAE